MRGCGYIPSQVDDRDYSLVGGEGSLFGAVTAPTPPWWLVGLGHVKTVNDQGGTQSCVWQAIQQQHRIAQALHGIQQPVPLSVMFGYWHTRKCGGTEKFDLGCAPRLAWQAAQKMGFCKEKLWSFNEAEINRPPSFDATAGAIDQKWLGGYYNIWGLTGRDAEVRLALSQNHPVVFGTIVDEPFMKYRVTGKAEPLKPPTSYNGRHMMCAAGYEDDGLWVVNSWGPDWGAPDPHGRFPGGFFKMSWEWVNWYQTSDWWVVTVPKEFAP